MFTHTLVIHNNVYTLSHSNILNACQWNTILCQPTELNEIPNYGIVTSLLAHIIWIKMKTPIRFLLYWIRHQRMVLLLDINECSLSMDNCHTNASCTNIGGSFVCTCGSGYTGNGTVCVGNYTNLIF